jgi:hypothetical protein
VDALPGLPFSPPVGPPNVPLAWAPAEPDWNQQVGSDPLAYAVRVGDLSAEGTVCITNMGRWVKKIEGEAGTLIGTARWEREV